MEIGIRRMETKDLDRVMEIEKESFSVPWSRNAYESELLKNSLSVYIVAQAEGQIVGYGGMWLILDEAHITNVAVEKSLRGNGIGEKIVEFLVEEASRSGINSLTLEVRENNEPARRLYEKMGFLVEGIRPGYYQDNKEDGLIMWKRGNK